MDNESDSNRSYFLEPSDEAAAAFFGGNIGGDAYLEKVIGLDQDELQQFSPVNRIADLRAPVLIAHGKKDKRAPFEHAKRLRKAMDKYDKHYEWFVKRREAHGFYDNDNQVDYLQAAIAFLNKYLSTTEPQ